MKANLILVVDDERSILTAVSDVLQDEGFDVRTAESGEKALECISEELPDLVLLDVWLPGWDGLETLTRLKELQPYLGVIMISGHGNIETAVKATKLGAMNFIEKPLSLHRLLIEIRQALKQLKLERENRELKRTIEKFQKMIGNSQVMKGLRELIAKAGPSKGRVLIFGESGTGKELAAREIHNISDRMNGPFVEVNCAAIPEDLIESELFGHEKGAFTNATYMKKGKFELASGGTLFLDEVGDMSLKTQAKVLRALEENRIERVGGNKSISVDVRVIAASNKNLEEKIVEGNFREDLFYRLNVIPISIPPLREHSQDIPALINHYLDLFCQEYGKSRKIFGDDAMDVFLSYPWPGNIRELKNEIERLVIMCPHEKIRLKDLRETFRRTDHHFKETLDFSNDQDLKSARENFELSIIIKRLEENHWNVTQTAENLGIERSNLHRKMKQLGISTSMEKPGR